MSHTFEMDESRTPLDVPVMVAAEAPCPLMVQPLISRLAFECDDVIRSAHVSRKREQQQDTAPK